MPVDDISNPAPAIPATGATPRTQRFRRASNAINLTPDQRRRQAAAMQLAWTTLGSREAVMAFFNDPSDALGGRPLDLAVDSDQGLVRVQTALKTMVVTGGGE